MKMPLQKRLTGAMAWFALKVFALNVARTSVMCLKTDQSPQVCDTA
jgi:hypothetical protein